MFDRLDILQAHYLYYTSRVCGQGSYAYAQVSKILRMWTPGPFFRTLDDLTPNGREIYDNLVHQETM